MDPLLNLWDRPSPRARPVEGVLPVSDAATLLRRHLQQVAAIQQLVGVPRAHWGEFYASAFVQQLPASEAHHHSGASGMLAHSLEVVHEALKLRRGRLIPSGASAERLLDCQDLWTYAVAMAALLHDLGKTVTDQRILLYNRQGQELGPWSPITGPFPKEAVWYKLEFVRDRQYSCHMRIPPLLAHFILPSEGLQWLACDPEVLQAWLASISGDDDHSGVMGELVHQADSLSVASNLTGKQVATPSARRVPLSVRLITGLRYLLDQGTLPLNRPGAAGWYCDDDIWLVSKRVLDALREHLIQEGQDGIPSRNDRLMDELQQHGLLIPNGDRAIWTVRVTDGDWTQQLTVLRFSAQLLWPDPESRHAIFSGTVLPVDPATEASAPAKEEQVKPSNESAGPEKGRPDAIDDASALRQADSNAADEDRSPVQLSPQPDPLSTPPPADQASDLGQAFIQWLKDGLSSGRLSCNAVNARVHTLPQGLFLVSPAIFRDFDRQRWSHAQKRFLRLKRHQRNPAGFNIWTCQVMGERKQSRIRGLLLSSPEQVLGLVLPPPNPHLTLME